jgi:hypothetical protein
MTSALTRPNRTVAAVGLDQLLRGDRSQAVQAKCAEDGAAARDKVPPLRAHSSVADRNSCVTETKADGTPSYVELQICLEIARDAKQ